MGKLWNDDQDSYTEGYGPKPHVQAGIDAVMRDVIRRDAHDNPKQLAPLPKTRVIGAVEVNNPPETPTQFKPNWVEPKPFGMPPGQDIIERLVDAALPHGVPAKKEESGE